MFLLNIICYMLIILLCKYYIHLLYKSEFTHVELSKIQPMSSNDTNWQFG